VQNTGAEKFVLKQRCVNGFDVAICEALLVFGSARTARMLRWNGWTGGVNCAP